MSFIVLHGNRTVADSEDYVRVAVTYLGDFTTSEFNFVLTGGVIGDNIFTVA